MLPDRFEVWRRSQKTEISEGRKGVGQIGVIDWFDVRKSEFGCLSREYISQRQSVEDGVVAPTRPYIDRKH